MFNFYLIKDIVVNNIYNINIYIYVIIRLL